MNPSIEHTNTHSRVVSIYLIVHCLNGHAHSQTYVKSNRNRRRHDIRIVLVATTDYNQINWCHVAHSHIRIIAHLLTLFVAKLQIFAQHSMKFFAGWVFQQQWCMACRSRNSKLNLFALKFKIKKSFYTQNREFFITPNWSLSIENGQHIGRRCIPFVQRKTNVQRPKFLCAHKRFHTKFAANFFTCINYIQESSYIKEKTRFVTWWKCHVNCSSIFQSLCFKSSNCGQILNTDTFGVLSSTCIYSTFVVDIGFKWWMWPLFGICRNSVYVWI